MEELQGRRLWVRGFFVNRPSKGWPVGLVASDGGLGSLLGGWMASMVRRWLGSSGFGHNIVIGLHVVGFELWGMGSWPVSG